MNSEQPHNDFYWERGSSPQFTTLILCCLLEPRWGESVNNEASPLLLYTVIKDGQTWKKGSCLGSMNEDGSKIFHASKTLLPHSEYDVCIRSNVFPQTMTVSMQEHPAAKRTRPRSIPNRAMKLSAMNT